MGDCAGEPYTPSLKEPSSRNTAASMQGAPANFIACLPAPVDSRRYLNSVPKSEEDFWAVKGV